MSLHDFISPMMGMSPCYLGDIAISVLFASIRSPKTVFHALQPNHEDLFKLFETARAFRPCVLSRSSLGIRRCEDSASYA